MTNIGDSGYGSIMQQSRREQGAALQQHYQQQGAAMRQQQQHLQQGIAVVPPWNDNDAMQDFLRDAQARYERSQKKPVKAEEVALWVGGGIGVGIVGTILVKYLLRHL